MSTTQQLCHEWHSNAFEKRKPLVVAKKILEEASELHIAAKEEPTNWDEILKECADTAIGLYALAGMADRSLDEAIADKIVILRERGRDEQRRRDRERGME